jgi:hypothetical protein
MDPLDAVRGGIPYVDPLQRARVAMDAADAAEARREQERREQRRLELEAQRETQAAVERMELFTTGHTERELAELRRQREDARRSRVAELEDEVARLRGPGHPGVARSQAVVSEGEMIAQVARSRQVAADEYMRAEVARFDRERAGRGC